MSGTSTGNNNTNSDTYDDRGLRKAFPKPNILRIEVLDGKAREKFLNGLIYKTANTMRDSLYNTLVSDNEKVFYGFLGADSDFSFNMSSNWENSSVGGLAIGAIKQVGNALGVGKVINGVFNTAQSAYDIVSSLSQMNSTATGSSTMKDFKSVALNDFTVSCVWYVPEQEKIAQTSLKILYRMMYPKQPPEASVTDYIKQLSTTIVNNTETKASEITNSLPSDATNSFKSSVSIPKSPDDNSASKEADIKTSPSSSLVATGVGVISDIGSFFGYNTTVNPLPVRVCIGQHMDIEPLVITNVQTKFSRELFVSQHTGKQLPIFANTTITFKYWLNPAPNIEFSKILGTELFGT